MKHYFIFLFIILCNCTMTGQGWSSSASCLEHLRGYAVLHEVNDTINIVVYDYKNKLVNIKFDKEGDIIEVLSGPAKHAMQPFTTQESIFLLSSKLSSDSQEINIDEYNFNLEPLSSISLNIAGYLQDFKMHEDHIYILRDNPSDNNRRYLEKYNLAGELIKELKINNSYYYSLDINSDGSIICSGGFGVGILYLSQNLEIVYSTGIENTHVRSIEKVSDGLFIVGKYSNGNGYFIAKLNETGDIIFQKDVNLFEAYGESEGVKIRDLAITESHCFILTSVSSECRDRRAIYSYKIEDFDDNCFSKISSFSFETECIGMIAPRNLLINGNNVFTAGAVSVDNTILPALFNYPSSCNIIPSLSSCELIDSDSDGFGSHVDCNDQDPTINPHGVEIPYNGVDEDCNPYTKDDDLDQDGFNLEDDCDDTNADINPAATEIPGNDIDENCDGLIVSIEELSYREVKIFPNPAVDQLNISPVGNNTYQYEIYNASGRLLRTGKSTSAINVSFLNTGSYIISIIHPGLPRKVIKDFVIVK